MICWQNIIQYISCKYVWRGYTIRTTVIVHVTFVPLPIFILIFFCIQIFCEYQSERKIAIERFEFTVQLQTIKKCCLKK